MAKNIAKEIKDLQQYHSVGHQCETREDMCPAIQGKRKDCNCGWKEYEDAVIKIATSQAPQRRKEICFTCNQVKIPLVCLPCRNTFKDRDLAAQKIKFLTLIEDRRETVDDKGEPLVRDIWVEDLLRAVKGL